MTNRGLIPGLNQDGWRRYEPQVLCAGAGGETNPTGLTEGTSTILSPFGRYLIVDRHLVVVETQCTIRSTSTVGSGSAYVTSLPFPARRWTGPRASSPVPLGVGMCYLSGSTPPNVNMPVAITLADPFASLAGTEDNYFQAYCPYILSYGGPVTISSATTTVTHQCGYTPRAEDIEIVAIDTLASTSAGLPTVQNITSTTFDVVVRSVGSNPVFNWKVRGKPPTGQTGALMSPTTPWDWTRATGAIAGNMFMQLAYEARR